MAVLSLVEGGDGGAAAESAGLQATGLLVVLLRSKKEGQIESVRQEMDALRTRARFFVAPSLSARVVEMAGE